METVDVERWSAVSERSNERPGSPLYEPGLVSDPSQVVAAIEASLRGALSAQRGSLPRVRAFNNFSLDFRSSENAINSSFPSAHSHSTALERIEEWYSGLERDERVTSIAFNEIDRWSPLSADLFRGAILGPMMNAEDDVTGSVGWYTFIGSSAWTPFGLHTDPEPSLIFHLGPAPKPVWVWEREAGTAPDRARAIDGAPYKTTDFEHLLSSAPYHFELQPGDFLYIPENAFHVFRNVDFSIFLGMALYAEDAQVGIPANLLAGVSDTTSWPSIRSAVIDYVESGGLLERAVENSMLARSRAYSSAPFTRIPRLDLPDLDAEIQVFADWVQVDPDDRRLYVNGHELRVGGGGSATLVRERLVSGHTTLRELLAQLPHARAETFARALFSCGVLATAPVVGGET